MSHMILTKDVYLKKALSVILEQVSPARKLCIVDIESYRSLGAIFRLLKRKKLTDKHGVIFIGGKDVSSRVLEPLVTIYRKSCFMEFRKQLNDGRTHSPQYALNHITCCRDLSLLSGQEKKTLLPCVILTTPWRLPGTFICRQKLFIPIPARSGKSLTSVRYCRSDNLFSRSLSLMLKPEKGFSPEPPRFLISTDH